MNARELKRELTEAKKEASMISLRQNIGRASREDVREARRRVRELQKRYVAVCDGEAAA